MKVNIYATAWDIVRRMSLVFALLLVGGAANAAEPVVYEDVQLDTPYELVQFRDVKASFTAPQSGVLQVKSTISSDYPLPYSDEDCTQEIDYSWTDFYGYSMPVEAGVTYYFLKKFVMNSGGTFTLSMATNELKLTSVSPEVGTAFSVSDGGQLTLTFNQVPKIGGLTVSSGSLSASVTAHISGNILSAELKETVYGWLTAGSVNPGDDLTVTLTNVRASVDESIVYGTDGTLTLAYKVPEKPVMLENASLPEKFLSYWVEGNAAGKVVLTFSDNLYTGEDGATLRLNYGNGEDENPAEYYTEIINGVVDANTLTFDLTGKLRTPQTMVASGTDYGVMMMGVNNVRDAAGNYVFSDGQGTLGSFSYQLPYEFLRSDVLCEFTPASGASLATADNLEIWLSDTSMLQFSGVCFTYMDGTEEKTVVVPMDQITSTPEGAELTLLVPVPAEVKGKANIIVTLADLVVADGLEHSNLTAKYDAFVVTRIAPAEIELEKLAAESHITVTTNMNDRVGYMIYEIRDMNAADEDHVVIKSRSWLTKSEDGTQFDAELPVDYKLVRGHEYHVIFTAYASEDDYNYDNAPLGTDYFVLTGLTEPFSYSSVGFVSINPDPESAVISETSQNVFTLTFDGLVELNSETTFINTGYGTSAAFESIEAVDPDSEGYSNVWQLTVAESFLSTVNNYLTLSVKAYDINGKLVQGNTGEEEQSYFNFVYAVSLNAAELVYSPADGAEVESLHEIRVSCAEGIAPSYLVSDADVKLYNRSRDEVAHVVSCELVIPEEQVDNGEYIPTEVVLTLSSEVTDVATYYLEIPAQYFILGSQMMTSYNPATTLTYSIAQQSSSEISYDFAPTSVSPASESTVESLSEIALEFEGMNSGFTFDYDHQSDIEVYNQDTRELVTTATIDWPISWDDETHLIITLATPVSDAGNYRVVIPRGLFGDTEWGGSNFTRGHANEGFALYYTVGNGSGGEVEETPAEMSPADGSTVSSLKDFTITFTEENLASYDDEWAGRIQLLDAAGNEVAYSDVSRMDFAEAWNALVFSLDHEVTEEGTYTLLIPAGAFILGDYGERACSELRFTYTIVKTDGIENVFAGGVQHADVYSSDGRLVLKNADAAALRQLPAGIYVAGGKKFILK